MKAMSPKKKYFAISAIFFLMLIVYCKVSYHGYKKDSETMAEKEINISKVIGEARNLKGILYDPLQGQLGNIGGKLGFIVCIDVPLIAYQNAGYSIKKVMEADFLKHPEHYNTKNGNTPENFYFSRRARNLYAYCKGNNKLIQLHKNPQAGDVVFYRRKNDLSVSHIALISIVKSNNSYWMIEAYPVLTAEISNSKVEKRGWIPVAFGRIKSN
jgi:uncharacterized protein YijF (DUF1287 family)